MLATFKSNMRIPWNRNLFIANCIATVFCVFFLSHMFETRQREFVVEMTPKILIENNESITYQYITRDIISGPTLHTLMVSKKFFSMKHKEYLVVLMEAKQGV